MSITTSKSAPKKTKAKETGQELLLVGLDLGTNTTCVQVARPTTASPASTLFMTSPIVGPHRIGTCHIAVYSDSGSGGWS